MEISLKSLSTFARCHQSWLESCWSVDLAASWGVGHYNRYLHFVQKLSTFFFSKYDSPQGTSFNLWNVLEHFWWCSRVGVFSENHALYTLKKYFSNQELDYLSSKEKRNGKDEHEVKDKIGKFKQEQGRIGGEYGLRRQALTWHDNNFDLTIRPLLISDQPSGRPLLHPPAPQLHNQVLVCFCWWEAEGWARQRKEEFQYRTHTCTPMSMHTKYIHTYMEWSFLAPIRCLDKEKYLCVDQLDQLGLHSPSPSPRFRLCCLRTSDGPWKPKIPNSNPIWNQSCFPGQNETPRRGWVSQLQAFMMKNVQNYFYRHLFSCINVHWKQKTSNKENLGWGIKGLS